MAILTQPHWEAVDAKLRDLLHQIGQQPVASRFYLAGVTALALQIGHRRSVDLDFFSELDQVKPETQEEILRSLAALNPRIIEKTFGHFVLSLSNSSVGFFSYGYAMVEETRSVENVALASLADIGLMKMDALASRGSRKDFYDLFFIAQKVSLVELLESSRIKYPAFRDFPMIFLKYMVLFDNADRDIQPDLLMPIDWDAVKNFFLEQAKQLGSQWFGISGS